MKLSAWAKQQGVTYVTAWRWFRDGKLPVKSTQLDTGTILVEPTPCPSKFVYVYARVSSPAKRDDLSRQAQRCVEYCLSAGLSVSQVVREVASGMNDKRPKLTRLLQKQPGLLVVEHKDRLTRFGFNYFELLLPMLGWKLEVINRDAEEKDDLLKDLAAIITSFCCRLYGLRRGSAKASQAKQTILCDEPAK